MQDIHLKNVPSVVSIVPKTLADRTHLCPNCGLEMDRDLNASLNIRTLGLRGRACREIGAPTQ